MASATAVLYGRVISNSQKGTMYTYKLVPAPVLSTVPILQHFDILAKGAIARPEQFKLHFYPFNDLPTITSHVLPHFAICNLGLKMQKAHIEYMDLAAPICADDRQRINNAFAVFSLWFRNIPPDSNFYLEPLLPADDGDDNNSTRTKQGHLDREGCDRVLRRHQGAAASPSSKGSHKRRRTGGLDESDGLWLDDETLRELDHDASPAKRSKQKMESVSVWVSSISESKFNPDVVV